MKSFIRTFIFVALFSILFLAFFCEEEENAEKNLKKAQFEEFSKLFEKKELPLELTRYALMNAEYDKGKELDTTSMREFILPILPDSLDLIVARFYPVAKFVVERRFTAFVFMAKSNSFASDQRFYLSLRDTNTAPTSSMEIANLIGDCLYMDVVEATIQKDYSMRRDAFRYYFSDDCLEVKDFHPMGINTYVLNKKGEIKHLETILTD